MKGEFESRLKTLIADIAKSPRPVILFIDEAHMLIGAGGAAGTGDAANILKPALARGELRVIAATTWAEYKRHFEKDAALARRFEVVEVEEPDEEAATAILRSLAPELEKHHGVRIRDAALTDAVRLSRRYITDRRLPDKAIGVLDTACARVALAQTQPPPGVEAARRRVAEASDAIARLSRDPALARTAAETLAPLRESEADARDALAAAEQRWRQEGALVQRVRALEDRLLAGGLAGPVFAATADAFEGLKLELDQMQGEDVLVPPAVDARTVAAVVSQMTGVPAGSMLTSTAEAIRTLPRRLSERVVGQEAAVDIIARRMRTYHAGLAEPDKPAGVFLLVGPSGVGKTETALALADVLFGGERSLITVNLSEYQEPHSVSGLRGAPPGYVGYGKGGVLTEAVRRCPYAVLLLDEAEKAHPDVLELFYQVFDKGVLEDSEGVRVDFRNTVILLTSNLGADLIEALCDAPGEPPGAAALEAAVRPGLSRHFKPALLGRMVIVPYRSLTGDLLATIAALKLAKVQDRVSVRYGAELSYDRDVINAIVDACAGAEAGARAIDHLLSQTLLPDLAERLMERAASGDERVDLVHVGLSPDGGFSYDLRSVPAGSQT